MWLQNVGFERYCTSINKGLLQRTIQNKKMDLSPKKKKSIYILTIQLLLEISFFWTTREMMFHYYYYYL